MLCLSNATNGTRQRRDESVSQIGPEYRKQITCCADWGALLLQVAKSGAPFLGRSLECTNFLILVVFGSSQNKLFVSLWVLAFHGLLAGATYRWIGLLPQGISLGHGGQRARTLELALVKHIKPFNIIFLSHPCFRTFLSTLCGNGFLKMSMRWDWNLPCWWDCWDCWDCWLLTPRSCRGYGATSLTSIRMAKGCSR